MDVAAKLTFAEGKKKKSQERFQLNLSRAHRSSLFVFPWIHRSLVLT